MTFANEGDWDRAVRMLAGILLMYAGSGGFVAGVWAAGLTTVGALSFITAIAGWCPGYTLFGFTTRKTHAGHCPNCETREWH